MMITTGSDLLASQLAEEAEAELTQAAGLLATARRPLLWCGGVLSGGA